MADSSYIIRDTEAQQNRKVKLIDNGNSTRSLSTSLGSQLAGEDLTNDVIKMEQRFAFSTITTATTTTVKSGAGFLRGLVVTGGTTGTIVVWDIITAPGTKITTNSISGHRRRCVTCS